VCSSDLQFVAAISGRRKYSSVVPYRQRGTNIHGALRSIYVVGCFWLPEKMNGRFLAIISNKVRRFFETETTQRTTGIHIPLPRHILRLFAQFVCHNSNKRRIALNSLEENQLGRVRRANNFTALEEQSWIFPCCGGFFWAFPMPEQLQNPLVV